MDHRGFQPTQHVQNQSFLQGSFESMPDRRTHGAADPQFMEHDMNTRRSGECAKAVSQTPDQSAFIEPIRDELNADPIWLEGGNAGARAADALGPRSGG